MYCDKPSPLLSPACQLLVSDIRISDHSAIHSIATIGPAVPIVPLLLCVSTWIWLP